jgi:hypothetical protein
MARLGSVLGGVLAEIIRARALADRLTQELLSEYESDPVLATLAVPRVTLSRVELALRFVVAEVEEVEAAEPDLSTLKREWGTHFRDAVLPHALDAFEGLSAEDRRAIITTVGSPSEVSRSVRAADVRSALRGRRDALVTRSLKRALNRWSELPRSVRRKIGTKQDFKRELESVAHAEAAKFLDRSRALADVRAALQSKLQVAIERDELIRDPTQVQEIRLTLHAEDLDLVVEGPREAT